MWYHSNPKIQFFEDDKFKMPKGDICRRNAQKNDIRT